MTRRASESLVAVLIRVALLIALAIMLMAENAQAQRAPAHSPHRSSLQPHLAGRGPSVAAAPLA